VIADLDRPALMVTGKLDRLIPWKQTKRIADEAAHGRFVLYEEGNHVCNNIPYRYRPLVADWLAGELRRVG
jgi:2,6-dihydroxypseudooxynicotine hydrolase